MSEPTAAGPPSADRLVAARAHTIALDGVAGHTLFPTPELGPWLPFERFAESVVTSGMGASEPHVHREEEVVSYVLAGSVAMVDPQGRSVEVGEKSVAVLEVPESITHDVYPARGGRARWISVVVRLPPIASGPTETMPRIASPTVETLDSGTRRRDLVGPRALRSRVDLELTDYELPPKSSIDLAFGPMRRAVTYVLDGSARLQGRPLVARSGVLTENVRKLRVDSPEGTRLIVSSVPIPSASPA